MCISLKMSIFVVRQQGRLSHSLLTPQARRITFISMKEDLKRILKGIQSGINYISEDIDAICDETMLEYAQEALNDLTEAEERIKALIEKQD